MKTNKSFIILLIYYIQLYRVFFFIFYIYINFLFHFYLFWKFLQEMSLQNSNSVFKRNMQDNIRKPINTDLRLAFFI